jgi:hypothetical protein
MATSIKRIQFWFVTVIHRYLNCATLSNNLLAIFILWLCPEIWQQDSNPRIRHGDKWMTKEECGKEQPWNGLRYYSNIYLERRGKQCKTYKNNMCLISIKSGYLYATSDHVPWANFIPLPSSKRIPQIVILILSSNLPGLPNCHLPRDFMYVNVFQISHLSYMLSLS